MTFLRWAIRSGPARQSRLEVLGVAVVMLAVGSGCLVGGLAKTSGATDGKWLPILVAVFAAHAIAAGAGVLMIIWGASGLIERVRKHDRWVCMKCHRELPQQPVQTRCAACGRSYTREQLVAGWAATYPELTTGRVGVL